LALGIEVRKVWGIHRLGGGYKVSKKGGTEQDLFYHWRKPRFSFPRLLAKETGSAWGMQSGFVRSPKIKKPRRPARRRGGRGSGYLEEFSRKKKE